MTTCPRPDKVRDACACAHISACLGPASARTHLLSFLVVVAGLSPLSRARRPAPVGRTQRQDDFKVRRRGGGVRHPRSLGRLVGGMGAQRLSRGRGSGDRLRLCHRRRHPGDGFALPNISTSRLFRHRFLKSSGYCKKFLR